jgi:nitrogen fixation/metabolism regulation signal transduction histidine kinase
VNDNARRPQDQTKYQQKYDSLATQYENLKQQLADVNNKKQANAAKAEELRRFIAVLRSLSAPPVCFDENLWNAAVESVTVFADDRLGFAFKSGTTVETSAKPA